jgi:nucleotide-binding universal stress UspA family protein
LLGFNCSEESQEVFMFERILVPLDRSPLAECVLPHAVAVARALGSQLMLLHILSQSARQDDLRAVDTLEWQLRRAEAESYLEGIRVRLQEVGVAAQTNVLDGDAAEQILAFARENQVGLVIISSHGQSGLSGWNVSSVVQKIMTRLPISTMIVRAYQPDQPDLANLRYRRVVVPLDSSPRAESVLPLAATLACTAETQILLAHVVQRPPMPRRTPPSQEDSDLADRIVERNRSEAEQYLAVVRSHLPPAGVETRLLISNHVAAALHELVDQEQIDLVLLSAHGYSGQMQWPYGGLVASFVTYGATPLFIFQDAPVAQEAAGVRSEERR